MQLARSEASWTIDGTMAQVYAGAKRSYHQMRNEHLEGNTGLSVSLSREQSPRVRSPSARPASAQEKRIAAPAGDRARKATFNTAASLVLVGLRGTGKSSLGVIAAAAYNYRLIETQRAFLDATGVSPSEYRASHGADEYQRRNYEVLGRTLQAYAERAVIICSFSDLEHGGETLLQNYAQTHPVVHVTRDAKGLYAYFRTWTLDRINQLLLVSGSILRRSCNFEFFNLTEDSRDPAPTAASEAHQRRHETQGKHLTLKRVERDFLRLLRNIVGDHGRSIAHHSAYPLSQIKVEQRSHTYAVRIELSDVIHGDLDLETVQIGADCIELLFDYFDVNEQRKLYETAHGFGIVRRNSILPIWLSPRVGPDQLPEASEASHEATRFCLSLGPELCSVPITLSDSQLQDLNSSKASTRLVASAPLPQRPSIGWRDQQCSEAYRRAARLGCDLIRLTLPAGPVSDFTEARSFCTEMRRLGLPTNVIAYEEGVNGRTSQCFNDILTSVRPALLGNPMPGTTNNSIDVTARSITEALFASFVLEPLRFYIYGRDVSYSLSPAMANAAYPACGLKHELTTFECNDLDGLQALVQGADFGGAAILQPFKTAVLPMLDTISSHAKAIQAVNTVVPIHALRPNGSMPDEVEIHRQRNRRGPLVGLYGTNTGKPRCLHTLRPN